MHNKQIEELLAEYMEKFGKDLNEQECRTGDELFMWLKEKLTPPNPRKLDLQATEQRLLKIIEAGEEARGETPPTQTWEARFKKQFAMPKKLFGGRYLKQATAVKDIESFIRQELKAAVKEARESERRAIIQAAGGVFVNWNKALEESTL